MRRVATSDKADKASEELAGYENRLSGIDRPMTALEARMASVEARVTMLMGAVSLNVALTAGVLWRLLSH